MRFIGREKELSFLEEEYAKKSSFVALWGREGFGQTAIINVFEQGKHAIRFTALIEVDSQCRRRFRQTLADYMGETESPTGPIDSWQGLFRMLADYRPEEKKLIILDNVQFLIEANKEFLVILRRCWDEFLSDCNIMLVTAGPIRTSTVQHYQSRDSIYQDGVVKVLNMRRFRINELSVHHPKLSFAQLVMLYTFTGGVPIYLDMFGDATHMIDCLENDAMRTSGGYHERPLELLEREVREPATYFSILTVIGDGNSKLLDIANKLDMKTNALGPYLSLLVKLGLIERRVPVTEPNPEKSRKGMYQICDHFLAFWFKYICPYYGELDRGNTAVVRELLEKTYMQNLLFPSYVKICTELLEDFCVTGQIPFTPTRIGSYWNSDNICPIDIIAVDEDNKRLVVADCFYLPEGEVVPADAFGTLVKKCAAIEDLRGYKDVIYFFFSNQNFSAPLQELANSSGQIHLVKGMDLLT
ncbi:MAG: AAA family ATPase [Oscillospiraceae bacterium]|nr:AAA family ATPase [Oscillospiraceae bacterium]